MNSLAQKKDKDKHISLSKVGLPKERLRKINHCLWKIRSIARTIDYHIIYNEKLTWKRVIDIVFGSIGLLGLIIIYPFIALGIKLSSDAPVIFKQKRAGFDGKEFVFYKFSSMHPHKKGTDDGKIDITQKDDDRIFKFGRFLRETNLDELPQFINVLKGDMSLVGPRPYTLHENSYWNTTFPDFYIRFAVKPGLTGLAQASGYRGGTLSLQHMSERLRLDLTYIKQRSLSLDIELILLTTKKMLCLNTGAH